MARDFSIRTDITGPNADYPDGAIKDESPAGSGNGTKINEAVYGDLYQTFLKLLRDQGVEPNGLEDNVSNSFQIKDGFDAELLKNAPFQLKEGANPSQVGTADIKEGIDSVVVGTSSVAGEITRTESFEVVSFSVVATGIGGFTRSPKYDAVNDRWFIGSSNGEIRYSDDDGQTWNASTVPAALGEVENFLFNGNTVIALGQNKVVRSANAGVLFSDISGSVSGAGDSGFYSSGLSRFINSKNANGEIMYSDDDGDSWTEISPIGSTGCKLFFAHFQFIAIEVNGGNELRAHTSTDGINWTAKVAPNVPSFFNAFEAIKAGTLYVALGSASDGLIYSTDLINWTVKSGSRQTSPGALVYDSTKRKILYTRDTESYVWG